jgi:hypothetical protein
MVFEELKENTVFKTKQRYIENSVILKLSFKVRLTTMTLKFTQLHCLQWFYYFVLSPELCNWRKLDS